ncbi:uncharacterized protein V1516DRAFT_124493 [Lipomyces oligophaga]|uniref:uncharacterized protein n=1 Tax=Lipomyces oligophaga TaxID=45792 RepID=UPI0034CF6C87
MTSKLLISKHQQVQLLEAASILVSMTEEDELAELRQHALAMRDSSEAQDRVSSEMLLYDEDVDVDDDTSVKDYEDSDDVGVFGQMDE